MFPRAYLDTFWQMNVRPTVFVAMAFADSFKRRYDTVIAPAIRSVVIGGQALEPVRVDLLKTGDSILTDIIDGIAHCALFLADVSTVFRSDDGMQTFRNGNVMYEVGLAVACRQPSEILLIKDDRDKFLFDTSTIPHATFDFTHEDETRKKLQDELEGRLRETQRINDARVQRAIDALSDDEVEVVKAHWQHDVAWGFANTGSVNFRQIGSIPRLLDLKQASAAA